MQQFGENAKLVATNFVPHLLEPVLGDYQRNVPGAREPEVLSLFTCLINKLQGWAAAAAPTFYIRSGSAIDPAKVVRAALQDAASVAGLLITTEAMIADKPEDKSAAAPAMPDMDGMGGMGGMGGMM